MRKRHLHHLLSALTATVLLALASPWAAAASADTAQVTVVSPGGATQTLALDALAGSEDVVDRTYLLRSAAGESTQTVRGFSLARLLDAAGADPYGFSFLEVQRPAGGTVVLSRDQALDAGAFADGPPVIYKTATGTAFLRPNAGPSEYNADDLFEAPQGISIVLRKGTQLQVRAEASATKVKVGQEVSFSVTVEGAGAGEQLVYSWTFDDGGRGAGDSVSHAFAKRGSYDVVVGVTTAGNKTGASDVVTVQVGPPVEGGPDRKGGGTNKAADAPDHGAADGPSGTGLSSVPTGTVPPVPAAPAPATAPAPAPPRQPAKTEPEAQVPPGEEVEGELVSATTDLSPPEQKQPAARTGTPEGDAGGGGGLPTAAWGLLATVGLLGAGALIEARRLPRLAGLLPGGGK